MRIHVNHARYNYRYLGARDEAREGKSWGTNMCAVVRFLLNWFLRFRRVVRDDAASVEKKTRREKGWIGKGRKESRYIVVVKCERERVEREVEWWKDKSWTTWHLATWNIAPQAQKPIDHTFHIFPNSLHPPLVISKNLTKSYEKHSVRYPILRYEKKIYSY